jgi:heme-degrading monooxygenase HmoA
MPVKVMIKRKWQVENPEELYPLLAELRASARKQPGFISGETLRSLDDSKDFLVISIWETPCVRIVVAWPKNLYKRENLGVKEVQPCDIHLNEKRRYCVK